MGQISTSLHPPTRHKVPQRTARFPQSLSQNHENAKKRNSSILWDEEFRGATHIQRTLSDTKKTTAL